MFRGHSFVFTSWSDTKRLEAEDYKTARPVSHRSFEFACCFRSSNQNIRFFQKMKIHIISHYHFALSFHINSYRFISVHIVSHHFISFHIGSYPFIPSHIVSYRFILFHIIQYRFIAVHMKKKISFHMMSCHFIPSHIVSYRFILIHIISYRFISVHMKIYHFI